MFTPARYLMYIRTTPCYSYIAYNSMVCKEKKKNSCFLPLFGKFIDLLLYCVKSLHSTSGIILHDWMLLQAQYSHSLLNVLYSTEINSRTKYYQSHHNSIKMIHGGLPMICSSVNNHLIRRDFIGNLWTATSWLWDEVLICYSKSKNKRPISSCTSCYRPPTKFREGNVFTTVCHSVHRGGGTPPSRQHTPLGTIKADTMYPTGMLSCYRPQQ